MTFFVVEKSIFFSFDWKENWPSMTVEALIDLMLIKMTIVHTHYFFKVSY